MKNILIISAIVVGIALFFAFRPSLTTGGTEPENVADDKVEVIYFHYTRRCVTCLAVENKTREALIALYPEEFSTGKITFASVVGAFMYFATLTELPIVQGLIASGMGKGPALALLLAGPSLSLPDMLVIKGIMGMQKTVVYVSLVVMMATISGLIYGAFL